MAKITLLLVGKTNPDYIQKGIDEYEKRIKRYTGFEIKTLKGIRNAKNMPPKVIKEKEGEQILNSLKQADHLIILDEKGKQFTSVKFSESIQKKLTSGTRHIVFLIGGAYGFSDSVYSRANEKLSLSDMTFSHQPIRLLFMEQLYRAFTIIKGEPYHNV